MNGPTPTIIPMFRLTACSSVMPAVELHEVPENGFTTETRRARRREEK